jgi:hypothetical protein
MLLKVLDRSGDLTPKSIEAKLGEATTFTQMVEQSYEEDQEKVQKKKINTVKAKVMGIARMNLMLKKMRENNEALVKIK